MGRGGKRPGAGAPKGNMNALKHGRYSKQFAEFGRLINDIDPRVREALTTHSERAARNTRRANEKLALLLTSVLQRGAEIAQRGKPPQPKKKTAADLGDLGAALGLNLDLDADVSDSITAAADAALLCEIQDAVRHLAKLQQRPQTQSDPDTNPPPQSNSRYQRSIDSPSSRPCRSTSRP